MIIGDQDDLTLWDKDLEAFNLIPTQKKQVAIVRGTGHMDIYSKLPDLEAVAKIGSDWIQGNL